MIPPKSVPSWIPLTLLSAFLVHNVEEALTYGRYRARAEMLIHRLVGNEIPVPAEATFHLALLVVSTLATVVVVLAIARPGSPMSPRASIALALIMLINVLIPHVPAAILMGGYAPGVATAVLLNLPISIFVLRRVVPRRTAP